MAGPEDHAAHHAIADGLDIGRTRYVKVNMDGVPFGRKLDVRAYTSYKDLLTALEYMFHNPIHTSKLRIFES